MSRANEISSIKTEVLTFILDKTKERHLTVDELRDIVLDTWTSLPHIYRFCKNEKDPS